jgi:hypothetical protein
VYFLDDMSFDEINALLGEKDANEKSRWEHERAGWFFSLVAQGSKAKKPEDVFRFSWEKKKKQKGKTLDKEHLKIKAQEAKQWLDKTK